MNVATIGSGVIVDRMIEAMRLRMESITNCNCGLLLERKKEQKNLLINMAFKSITRIWKKMLNDENVDIVYVASPNSLQL